MINTRRTSVVCAAVGAFAFASGTVPEKANADAPEPRHHVTCKWNKNAGTPWAPTSTTVQGYAQVICSDKLDDANTRAQLQIFKDGSWRDHGNWVTSYQTLKNIHVNAKASKRIDSWRYRVKGTHFGQHGNVWTLPTYYSPIRMLWRRG